ncbi:hypothetical protein PTHTG4_27090 [Parageobacillus thermoglucosidasius]|nr:hypothetical protein PTHTG4_27090 [Parageobacillus thermoglucosidasius]
MNHQKTFNFSVLPAKSRQKHIFIEKVRFMNFSRTALYQGLSMMIPTGLEPATSTLSILIKSQTILLKKYYKYVRTLIYQYF